jgi:hypothetical protein
MSRKNQLSGMRFLALFISVVSSAPQAEVNLRQQVQELYPESIMRLPKTAPSESGEKSAEKKRLLIPYFDLQFLITDPQGQQQVVGTSLPGYPLASMFHWLRRGRGVSADEFLALDDEEKLEWMNKYAERIDFPLEQRQQTIESGLVLLEIAQMAQQNKTEDQIMDFLGEKMRAKNYDDKLRFLVSVLSVYKRNYDMARIEEGNPARNGVVTTGTMLKSAFETLQGFDIEEVPDAGVCRDMHQSVVRMARAMGMEETYGVSYITKSAGHLNLVTSDPNDRSKTYVVNYGQLFVNEGQSSSAALSQLGIEDVGLGYTTWGPDNRPIMYIPSERGAVLNIVAGGSDQDFDPIYKHQSNISKLGLKTPWFDVRVFNSNNATERQEVINGVAANTRVQFNQMLFGEYGVAAYYASRNHDDTGSIISAGVLARLKQGLEKNLYSDEHLSVGSYTHLHLSGSVFNSRFSEGSGSCDWNGDANGNVAVGLKADMRYGQLQLHSNFEQRVSAHSADVQDFAQGIAFYFPVTTLRQGIEFDLGDLAKIEGEVALFYRPMQDKHYFSASGQTSAIFNPTQTKATIGAQGALNQAMPLWVPGSERRAYVKVEQSFWGQFYLVGEGETSFDFPGQNRATFGIGGKF